MSNAAITWAECQPTGSSGTRHLLVTLANAASDKPSTTKTGKTWPANCAYLSIAALVERTLQNRKTVIRNLKILGDGDFIRKIGTEGRTNQILVFELAVVRAQTSAAPVPKAEPVPESEPVPKIHSNGTAFPSEQSQFFQSPVPNLGHGSQRNPIEPKKTPKEARAAKVRAIDPDAIPILEGVDQQTLEDLLKVRKAKRAGELTVTAARGLVREAGKAGITVEEAAQYAVERSWVTFTASYFESANRQPVKRKSIHSGFSQINYHEGL